MERRQPPSADFSARSQKNAVFDRYGFLTYPAMSCRFLIASASHDPCRFRCRQGGCGGSGGGACSPPFGGAAVWFLASSAPHVDVSLGKILNAELLLMAAPLVCEWLVPSDGRVWHSAWQPLPSVHEWVCEEVNVTYGVELSVVRRLERGYVSVAHSPLRPVLLCPGSLCGFLGLRFPHRRVKGVKGLLS